MTIACFPALSVRQPWAELIVSGRKRLEIRAWQRSYRGRIWVHAGKHVDERLDASFGMRGLYRGGFIGSVDITAVEPLDERRWEAWREWHQDSGPFQPGTFAWVLANPRTFVSPVPGPGGLGLFDVPSDLCAQLISAEERARTDQ